MKFTDQAFKPEVCLWCMSAARVLLRAMNGGWDCGICAVFVFNFMKGCIALGVAPPPIIHVQTCSPGAEKAS